VRDQKDKNFLNAMNYDNDVIKLDLFNYHTKLTKYRSIDRNGFCQNFLFKIFVEKLKTFKNENLRDSCRSNFC